MKYLHKHKIDYDKIGSLDKAAIEKLEKASGQAKTATLFWNAGVLVGFEIDEVEEFLAPAGRSTIIRQRGLTNRVEQEFHNSCRAVELHCGSFEPGTAL